MRPNVKRSGALLHPPHHQNLNHQPNKYSPISHDPNSLGTTRQYRKTDSSMPESERQDVDQKEHVEDS
jgi:hypothetical protein